MTASTPSAMLDPRPVPPEAPLPGDCCDSGCSPCVNDIYTEELQEYRQELAAWLARNPDANHAA